MEEKSYFYMRLSNKKTVKLQQSCAMVTEKDLYDVQALKWWWNFEGGQWVQFKKIKILWFVQITSIKQKKSKTN